MEVMAKKGHWEVEQWEVLVAVMGNRQREMGEVMQAVSTVGNGFRWR